MAIRSKHRLNIHTVLWMAWLCMAISATATQESGYIVKRGDTLTSIARKSGVTVSTLAERNGLSKNHYVAVGQRLIIPRSQTRRTTPETKPAPALNPAVPAAAASLPKAVSEAINNEPVRAGRWKYIVIHHSAVDEGTMKGMDDYHRKQRHMEHGLAYHFVIGNGNGMRDGEIGVGNRWKQQLDGGHLRSESQNKVALGICLVGNYDAHPPSTKQMQSLNALVRALMKRCGVSTKGVKTHQQINVIGTRCPGSRFPSRSFLNGLKSSS